MTFLPYPDFIESFKVLDYKRLGKQRVEAFQILNVLTGVQKSKGWHNHPAVTMWKGYESALVMYHNLCIVEWKSRGYKNNMALRLDVKEEVEMPWWFGNENLHRSHRARLIEKNTEFYEPLFLGDKGFNFGKYFWPVMETKTFKII